MKMNQKNLFLLALPMVLIATLSVFNFLEPQAQQNTEFSPPDKQLNKKKNFPKVDYYKEEFSEERKEKSKKYDKGLQAGFVISLQENNGSTLSLDWAVKLNALPIDKSDLVLLGKVIKSNAYLSKKKVTVYSEFKIQIEQIYKNNSEKNLKAEKFVYAEREGGIVTLPSGFEHWHKVDGQQMPEVAKEYLFFLTHNFPLYGKQKSFYLLTAYEVTNGKVNPLDDPGDNYPIVSVYKDKNKSVLLNDLQTALQNEMVKF